MSSCRHQINLDFVAIFLMRRDDKDNDPAWSLLAAKEIFLLLLRKPRCSRVQSSQQNNTRSSKRVLVFFCLQCELEQKDNFFDNVPFFLYIRYIEEGNVVQSLFPVTLHGTLALCLWAGIKMCPILWKKQAQLTLLQMLIFHSFHFISFKVLWNNRHQTVSRAMPLFTLFSRRHSWQQHWDIYLGRFTTRWSIRIMDEKHLSLKLQTKRLILSSHFQQFLKGIFLYRLMLLAKMQQSCSLKCLNFSYPLSSIIKQLQSSFDG